MDGTAHTLVARSSTPASSMTTTISPPAAVPQAPSVAELARGAVATVTALRVPADAAEAALIQRLIEIGFVPGEKLRIVAVGHPGREPIAVRIGTATFALRRFEAQCVLVAPE